jgi:hypothetical protein
VCRTGSARHPRPRSVSLTAVRNPARKQDRSQRSVRHPLRKSVRVGMRAAVALFGAVLVLIPALPASAANTDFGKIGDVYSPDGLSLPLAILLYGGIPLVGFVIAGTLALWSAKGSSQRYRPGRPWTKEPVWFGDESSLEREPQRAALPGSGGASGSW